jgi:type IV pilus assembly protein PilB
MLIEDSQLKKFILDSGLVSQADLDAAEEAATKEGHSMGDILVTSGKLSPDNLRRIQAYVLGIPFVELAQQKIPFDVLSLIPEPIARSHNIVAFKKSDDTLEVAMLNVDDLSAIDFIKKKVNLKIAPRLTDAESIKSVILQYQKSLKAEFGDIIQKESSALKVLADTGVLAGGATASVGDIKKMAEDLPVIRIVDTLLKHAILQDASDIHIEPLEDQTLIRYRIDGILHDAMVLPKNAESPITARIKVLANLKLDEKRLPQDGRFQIDMNGEKVSFRVSVLPTYYGEKTVMRLLRQGGEGFSLEHSGFHGEGLERIHHAITQTTGMILTTGPTGSGKTTTLYTILDLLNTPNVNISTIEDPIEYQMRRVNQTQVKPEIGFTFANGLRTLVRQDPDIIMVGEIRDNETASLAVNAALTGHLVLSTLHTNSAAGAIPRLLDMKIEPFLLVSTLNVIVGQRLVRQLSDTKEKHVLTADEIAALGKIVDLDSVLAALKTEKIIDPAITGWEKIPFYKPVSAGSDKDAKDGRESGMSGNNGDSGDKDDGYKGRVGIHEVLCMTETIRTLVIKGSTSAAIEIQAKKEGMLTMIEDGIFKCVQGLTTIEEVLRVVSE